MILKIYIKSMINFRRLSSYDDYDLDKFIKLKDEYLVEDIWVYNFVSYPWEDGLSKDLLKEYDLLKNTFVLESGDRFIWLIEYVKEWEDKKRLAHNLFIWPIYIKRPYRWNWYSKILLEELISELKTQYSSFEFLNMQVMVNSNNKPSIGLFKSFWFEKVWYYKDYIKWWGEYFDVILYNKKLEIT